MMGHETLGWGTRHNAAEYNKIINRSSEVTLVGSIDIILLFLLINNICLFLLVCTIGVLLIFIPTTH
jgi:hypothetical protein